MITKIQLKEIIHRKYDWILDDLKSHDKIAMVTSKLLQGIDICLKKKSDLPYYATFYSDYFCVYNIDSIIDMAFSLEGNKRKMCLTLLKSSLLYHQDKKSSLKKSLPKEEGKTIELSDAYLDIRNRDEIWAYDDKVIEFLVAHYAEELKRLPFQISGYLTTRKDEKKLKRKYKDYDVKYEKYRFIKLLQRSQDELSKGLNSVRVSEKSVEIHNRVKSVEIRNDSPQDNHKGISSIGIDNNRSCAITHDTTNLGVLDTPITEVAEEIELNIADNATMTSKTKYNSNKVRVKEDISYSEQQAISKKIGERGEELVLRNEIKKIKEWGLPNETLSKVRRVSLESDDYGFDILSFDRDGNERYLEVKTTKTNGKNFSFVLTRNEFEQAKKYGNKYSFVIVFDILSNPCIWNMGNPFVEEPYKVEIQPIQYRVDINTTGVDIE